MVPSTSVKSSTNDSGLKARSNSNQNRISRPSSSNQNNKKVEASPRNVKSCLHKMKRVSDINENVKHGVCSICNECLFNANHDMCVVDYLNDVNARVRNKSVKSVNKKEWKPTGKVFTNVGHKWGVQIILWYLDSGCSKHITGQRSQLISFVSKFIGTIRFGNDQVAAIMGYGDYQIRNVTISIVYYVEGLGHNLFSVGQLCDVDLEVAFQKHFCFVRDLNGVDLLKGSLGSNLYTISLEDMLKSSPICLLSKASKTKAWLWHHRLSHLNFGKSNKHSHKPKSINNIQEKLYLLHMDLCGPMRVESIHGKKYILVIVDDFSRFTWVKFLCSKDETPEFVIKFLKKVQVTLNATVRNIRTDNGTEFVNQTLKSYYEDVRISHQTTVARTPQQNSAIERRNQTLVEAARTMLIFSKAPLFLWAEAVATTCYTQNRSLIRTRHNKTPYEMLHDRKRDIKHLHVFGALCYLTNDSEDFGKLKPKLKSVSSLAILLQRMQTGSTINRQD
ncbi:retrovirus-related pol polyprotein from transposon TNT 1-94 [Tanacetum coccineum]